MKICFWIGSAYYRPGGTSKIVSVITGELAKNHDVDILIIDKAGESRFEYDSAINIVRTNIVNAVYRRSKDNLKDYVNSSIRVINNKTGYFNTEKSVERLKEAFYPAKMRGEIADFLNTKNYDVIIATGSEIMWLATMHDQLDAKLIGWQHNSYKSYFKRQNILFWQKETIAQKYLPLLDDFVLLNEYDQQEFDKMLGVKSTVIHNALTLTSDVKTNPAQKQFLMTGSLIRQKGVDTLLKAFQLFCEHNTEWKLIIAGEGKDRNELIKKIWQYKIQERVHMIGFTSNIKDYFLSSSVYLMSSRFEGWGLVVTEAFEMGLPVVAFNITPMDIIIDTGVNGIIVEANNINHFTAAMLRLANDEKLREKMSEEAVKKAKNFNLDKIMGDWQNLVT